MRPEEYAIEIKTKFGDTVTSDGRKIRDLDDRELVRKMITRYPGEKEKIVGVDEFLGGEMPPEPPKTPQQAQAETAYKGALEKFGAGLMDRFRERDANVKEHMRATDAGEQNIASEFLQKSGEVAGFVGDVGFEAVKALLPDDIKKGIKDTLAGVASSETAQGLMESYDAWKTQNPELAENVEASFNIATVIPGVGAGAKAVQKGVKAGTEAVEQVAKAVPGAVEGARGVAAGLSEKLAPNLGKEAMDIAVIGPQGKKATVSSLEKSGRPGGYAPDDSFIGKLVGADKYVPTKRDMEVAEAVQGVVRKSNTPAKNIASINNKIAEVSETEVRPTLRQHPSPFNVATYSKKLREVEMPDFIKTDEALARTYETVRNRFIDVVKGGVKTKEGLWDSRKSIDDVIEQQFGAAGFNPDKYSALQKAILDMRRATNDFISEGIPDSAFKAQMKRLSRMYEAKHNIALDNYALQSKDGFEKWVANNPKKWAALKVAGWTSAIGGVGMFLD